MRGVVNHNIYLPVYIYILNLSDHMDPVGSLMTNRRTKKNEHPSSHYQSTVIDTFLFCRIIAVTRARFRP
jgi:hypothetical protein